MNLFNRLVVVLLALALALGGALVLVCAAGLLPPVATAQVPALARFSGQLLELTGMARLWVTAGSGSAALVGALVLFLEARDPGRVRELVIHRDGEGEVAVSLAGLRRLAEHVIGKLDGVERVVSLVRPTRKGLLFDCRLQVRPDTNSRLLAEEVRGHLSAAVENHIGQPVYRIHVRTQIGTPTLNRRRVR